MRWVIYNKIIGLNVVFNQILPFLYDMQGESVTIVSEKG